MLGARAVEVRDAIRNMLSAQEWIEAAERRRLAAAEQFRAESIRLEHGESTPFDVLQRERDLVDAPLTPVPKVSRRDVLARLGVASAVAVSFGIASCLPTTTSAPTSKTTKKPTKTQKPSKTEKPSKEV